MRVKICGITTPQEGLAAASAGADAVGTLVGLEHESDDGIAADAARAVFASLPPYVSRVLVTHRTSLDRVADLVRVTGATVVQLHGEFPLEEIPRLREAFPYLAIVKSVHVTGDDAIGEAASAARFADAVLLDSRSSRRIGGTGTVHDWSISARIVSEVVVPVILAGGLHAGNVGDAIRQVRPWGVDVNSGTKDATGRKSIQRIGEFIAAVRTVDGTG